MEASGFVPLAHDEKPSGKHGRIDHIIPQSVDPSKSMDYSNLCFSCPAEWGQPKGHMYTHCDRHKAADLLPITPLQEDCLDNFIFASTGHVLPSCAEVAKDFFLTRDILNLDVGHLVTRRQLFIEALEEVLSEEDIENVRSRYATRDANGMFPEFYFIAISIIDRQLGKK